MPQNPNLYRNLIDYAGLFPPASLPLDEVVQNFQAYVVGEHEWMLARLIVPATRLEEFSKIQQDLIPESPSTSWKISALIPSIDAPDEAFAKALDAIEGFNQSQSFAIVDTVEGKLPHPELAASTTESIPESLIAFLEVPPTDPGQTIEKLADSNRPGTFAKIRTGNVKADLIPGADVVAKFIHKCAAAELGFKATAGLHHPLRGEYALTYDENAERGTMHGFLNVFLAACLARHHEWDAEQLTRFLECSDGSEWEIQKKQVTIGDVTISDQQIIETRNHFAISFGSCSFTEPVEELIQGGWLADSSKSV